MATTTTTAPAFVGWSRRDGRHLWRAVVMALPQRTTKQLGPLVEALAAVRFVDSVW
jgi:hypothetical protein